jgi:hypothetical protein
LCFCVFLYAAMVLAVTKERLRALVAALICRFYDKDNAIKQD